jgi:hypothetical protein
MYRPDNWVILKITINGEVVYKILCGWSGGYLDGDSWRMSSGITGVEEDKDYFMFSNHSGSIYRCHKDSETLRANCSGVLTDLVKQFPDQIEQIWYEDFINEFPETLYTWSGN